MSVKMGILSSIITEAGKLAADIVWKRISRDEKVLRLLEAVDLKPERAPLPSPSKNITRH